MNPKFASTFTLLLVLCSTSVLSKRLIIRLSAPPLAEYPRYAKLRHQKLSAMNSIDATSLSSIKEAVFLQQKKLITSLPKGWSVSKLLTENGLKVSKYHVLLNAVVINVPDTEAKYAERILSKVPGVVSVSEVRYFKTNLHTSREAINALAAWKALNSTEKDAGRGVKIAVVDTGIYTPNALFNDNNMEYPIDGGYPLGEVENCNKKVIASRLYLDPNGTIASYDNHSYPSEEASAHGTHCASTAAGSFAETDYNGVKLNLTGVAPGAWLMNYRIFHVNANGYERSVSDEQIIQAFEDLVKDGADIVSNSWGSTALYSYGSALDAAIKALTLLNVPVIFSASNKGPDEATVDKHFPALRVGATTSGAKLAYKITTTPSIGKDIEYILARNCSRFNGTFKLYAANETNSYGCKPFPYTFSSDENAAIVMLYGSCLSEKKINNTAATGAKLAIVISDDEDAFTMYPKYLATNAICVGAEGIDLIEMARNQTNMSVEVFSVLDIIPVDKDVLASFSSRGPTVDMALAPDLCAPGVKIYAAGYGSVGDNRMGFGQISGTSMACPHVAGASALVLAEHPDFTTFEVYSALMSTANYKDVMDYDGTPGQPLSAGAGRIDVAKAINPTLYLNPQSLSFSLVPVDKSEKLEFTAKNYLNTPVTLSIKAVHHVDKGAVEEAPTWVTVEPSTVVISGSGEVTVTVTIDAINGEIGDEQGYIVLEDSNTNEEIAHLPYWARVVYKESDRVDVYLVDADMSECRNVTNYQDRYTSVLNASGITYKVLDICDDDEVLEAASNELLYLKSRSVIFFSGDKYTYLSSTNAMVRQVLHSGVPVILMGSNMPYSWRLYDGSILAYGLPYEFKVIFQTRDKVIKRVKAGAYASWTMKSLEFDTNFVTRPLSLSSNRVILTDGNNNTLAVAAYSVPSIYDVKDDAKINSFSIFSVVGLESINSTEHSTTLLMGLYNYSISSINCSVVSEKKSGFEYQVNVKCDGNFSYLGINWGDKHISRKPYGNMNEYGTYHNYSDVGTYTIRVIVRSIYGKYFELDHVKIDVDGITNTSSSSSLSSSSSSSSAPSTHSSISSSTFNSKSSLPLSLSTSSSNHKSDSFGKTISKFALMIVMLVLLFSI